MLENQIKKLTAILTDEDVQSYFRESFCNFIQAVIGQDPFSGIAAGKNIKELVFHMPTVIFWDKMKRFLEGTFHDFQDQVKMAQKFNKDNEKYEVFVKRQIQIIDNLDDDMKIDFFAAVTRCLLLTDLDKSLYFKLCQFLSICTSDELKFLKDCKYDFKGNNDIMISVLSQYGLFDRVVERESIKTYYVLSDLAKVLKQNCLNYDDGLCGEERIVSYEQLAPLNIPESITKENIDKLVESAFGEDMG